MGARSLPFRIMKSTASFLRGTLLAVGFMAGAALSGAGISSGAASRPDKMILIPAGIYAPFSLGPQDAKQEAVAAFLLDDYPVTNGEFLTFLRANPKWQRSQISRLFADSSYLKNWNADLEPGPLAPLDSPAVHVSWFAARAYAHWAGKHLPTTAEWELAAGAGYTRPDGNNDPAFVRDLYAWFALPVPNVLPAITTSRANYYGVHGLHGLVWEWVDDFNSAIISSLDPNLLCAAGATDVKDTGDYAAFMRRALRSSLQANNTTSALGFRCARDPKVSTTASLP